jgi:hypothetical protein
VRQSRLVCIAFIVSIAALAMMVLPDAILSPPPEPKDGIVALVKSLWGSRTEPALVAFETQLYYFHIAAISAAIVAAAASLIGLAKRENWVLGVSALAIAATVILWKYLVIGIVVALVIVVLLGSGY